MENYNLDVAQRLMLVQGISLIEDGLQFLEWSMMPNDYAHDALSILRDRFDCFKDYANEDNELGHLIIDKAKRSVENTKEWKAKDHKTKILKALEAYRNEIVRLKNEREKEDKQNG